MTFETEAQAIAAGHTALTGAALKARLAGTTVHGLYQRGFRYVASIGEDGRLAGKNHVGTHDLGAWSVDEVAHTWTVRWENGWDHTTTRGYAVGEAVVFFDADSGLWRTTFEWVV